jgi:hypothetical protein
MFVLRTSYVFIVKVDYGRREGNKRVGKKKIQEWGWIVRGLCNTEYSRQKSCADDLIALDVVRLRYVYIHYSKVSRSRSRSRAGEGSVYASTRASSSSTRNYQVDHCPLTTAAAAKPSLSLARYYNITLPQRRGERRRISFLFFRDFDQLRGAD